MNTKTEKKRISIGEAQEIMSICYKHVLFAQGVIEEPPPSLKDYSLYDLLEAKKVIEEAGIHTMTCHERGLAALYVAYHFPASDLESVETIAMSADGRAVIVLDADQMRGENES